jgi:hypothetical protein
MKNKMDMRMMNVEILAVRRSHLSCLYFFVFIFVIYTRCKLQAQDIFLLSKIECKKRAFTVELCVCFIFRIQPTD